MNCLKPQGCLFISNNSYGFRFMQVCLRQTCEGGRDVLFQSPVFSARIKLGLKDFPISLNRPIYPSFDFRQNEVFNYLKPQVCLFVRNVSCRLLAAPKNILCKFANGKLGRTVNKITSVNPNFFCPPSSRSGFPERQGIIRWNKKRTEIFPVRCVGDVYFVGVCCCAEYA